MGGVNCNFLLAYYEIDRDTWRHDLALDASGERGRWVWVMLEPVVEPAFELDLG